MVVGAKSRAWAPRVVLRYLQGTHRYYVFSEEEVDASDDRFIGIIMQAHSV